MNATPSIPNKIIKMLAINQTPLTGMSSFGRT
jgi:hypothetical protein